MSLLGSVKKAWRGNKDKAKAKKAKKEPAVLDVADEKEKTSQERGEVIASMRSGAVTGILQQPHVTEKSTKFSEDGRYVFRVHPDATKIQIKKAVETLYGVHVASVNSISMPAKVRRRGRHVGTRSGYKKAIVALRKGQSIEILPH